MEMLIDKNDAFRHNVCKKLAQLGKVIFTLTAAQRDREDEMHDVSLNFEEQIAKFFERYKALKQITYKKELLKSVKIILVKKKKKGGGCPSCPPPIYTLMRKIMIKNNFENHFIVLNGSMGRF